MAINGETGITGNFGPHWRGEFCSFKTGIPGGPGLDQIDGNYSIHQIQGFQTGVMLM